MVIRRALLAALLGAAAAASAAAQERRAQPDTTWPVLIFSDVLSGRAEFAVIVLVANTAYRVEVIPSSAALEIRRHLLGGQPPMVLRSLEDAVAATGGRLYILVPRESGEYRVEASSAEPVRVRIMTDPREQALLEGRAGSALGVLSVGARAVWLGGPLSFPTGTVDGAAGYGLCLGVAPGTIPFARSLSGCALTYERLDVDGGTMTLFGLAPRYTVLERGRVALAVATNVGLGGTADVGNLRRITLYAAGVGLNLRVLAALRHLELELEPGVTVVGRDGYQTFTSSGPATVPGGSDIVPRLAAGLHARF